MRTSCRRLAVVGLLAGLFLSATAAAQGVRYAGAGAGFQLGFVVVSHVDPVSLGFDVGGHRDIAFSLGRFGEAHYKPALGIWFGGGHEYIQRPLERVERDWFVYELHLDIADLAYYFPLAERVVVRPYVGLGPSILVDHWSWSEPDFDDDHTDARVGLNLFGGADFRLSERASIRAEMRGRPAHWDLFELIAGMTFHFGRRGAADVPPPYQP